VQLPTWQTSPSSACPQKQILSGFGLRRLERHPLGFFPGDVPHRPFYLVLTYNVTPLVRQGSNLKDVRNELQAATVRKNTSTSVRSFTAEFSTFSEAARTVWAELRVCVTPIATSLRAVTTALLPSAALAMFCEI
jgi:hypothetical protein